jgi:phenol hydroxylase P5 protein
MAVQSPSFRYLPLVSPGGETEAVEHTVAMLRPLVEGQPKVIPMISGTKGFVRPLRAALMEYGYDRKDVKTETFD